MDSENNKNPEELDTRTASTDVAESSVAEPMANRGGAESNTHPVVAEDVSDPEPKEATVNVVEKAQKQVKENPFLDIVQFVIKPVTVLKERLVQYDNPRNAGILAGVILLSSVLLSIISSFFSVIVTYNCTLSHCGVGIDFGMLKYWDFGTFLFEDVASTVIIMLVIAGIFFGIAKLFKSQKASFWKVLSVVSLAMMPLVITGFVGAIIRSFAISSSFISDFMGIVATFIVLLGGIYTAIIFYEGITASADLEGDHKVYFVILSALAVLIALAILMWLIGDKISLDEYLMLDL